MLWVNRFPLESVPLAIPGPAGDCGLRAGRAEIYRRCARSCRHYRRAGAVLVPGLPALNQAIKANA